MQGLEKLLELQEFRDSVEEGEGDEEGDKNKTMTLSRI